MQIHYQFIAAAAIALIAGVGSISAEELSVANVAGDTGAPFAMLNGIETSQMSVQEMAATRGTAVQCCGWYVYDDSGRVSDATTSDGIFVFTGSAAIAIGPELELVNNTSGADLY